MYKLALFCVLSLPLYTMLMQCINACEYCSAMCKMLSVNVNINVSYVTTAVMIFILMSLCVNAVVAVCKCCCCGCSHCVVLLIDYRWCKLYHHHVQIHLSLFINATACSYCVNMATAVA